MNNAWKDKAGSHPRKGSCFIPFDYHCLIGAYFSQPVESDKGWYPSCCQTKTLKHTSVSSCKKEKRRTVSSSSLTSAELLWWKASCIEGERIFSEQRICWFWQRLCPTEQGPTLPLSPSLSILNICAFYGHFNQIPDGLFQSGDLCCSGDNNPLC